MLKDLSVSEQLKEKQHFEYKKIFEIYFYKVLTSVTFNEDQGQNRKKGFVKNKTDYVIAKDQVCIF